MNETKIRLFWYLVSYVSCCGSPIIYESFCPGSPQSIIPCLPFMHRMICDWRPNELLFQVTLSLKKGRKHKSIVLTPCQANESFNLFIRFTSLLSFRYIQWVLFLSLLHILDFDNAEEVVLPKCYAFYSYWIWQKGC